MSDAISERFIRTDVEMQVVARDESIHLLFSEDDGAGNLRPAYTPNFLMSAKAALAFARLLADLAFEVDSGLRMPHALKLDKVSQHREKLNDRLRVVLNSLREDRKIGNEELARQLVDIMSVEVFT
mgnify:CR=1 FL=1